LNMLLINTFFLIITIIAFVRFLFFQSSIVWMCFILIIWIALLISIERAKKGHHERLFVRKRKR